MKTTLQHPIYGRITYNDETKVVTVQRGYLAERITRLLKDKNAHLVGHGYWPDRFIRVCEVPRDHATRRIGKDRRRGRAARENDN